MISKKNAIINILFRSSNIIYLVALGILLVPMYLKYIPVQLYGYWLASGNIISWLGDLSSVSAVMQQRIGVSFGAGDYKKIGHYIGTSILISLLLLIVLLLLLTLFYHYVFDWLGVDNIEYRQKLEYSLIYAGIGLLLTLFSFGFSGINYGLQLFKQVGLLSMGTNLSCIAVTYLLLPGYSVMAFGLALLVRGCLDVTGNMIILWNFLRNTGVNIKFSKSTTRSLLGDVFFNFFSRIGSLLSKNSQLFFIARYITPESAVVFKFTKTIPEISRYFITVPAEAMMPVLSKYLGQNPPLTQVRTTISKMIYLSIWAAGLVFIGFALLNKAFINLWVGEAFYAGDGTNTIIILWVVVSLITTNLMYTVFALGDLRKNNLVLFIQSIIFIVLMLVLLKPFGIIGIALALLFSEACISLVYYPWSLQRYLHFDKTQISHFFKEVLNVLMVVLIMYLITYKINLLAKSWYGLIGYIVMCVIFYLTMLYIISGHFKKEINGWLFKWQLKPRNRNIL
ncbi:MAG: polysaccharide biosynthesis C-terminal domain-containing protein [Chitinophagaceae bacterium]